MDYKMFGYSVRALVTFINLICLLSSIAKGVCVWGGGGGGGGGQGDCPPRCFFGVLSVHVEEEKKSSVHVSRQARHLYQQSI